MIDWQTIGFSPASPGYLAWYTSGSGDPPHVFNVPVVGWLTQVLRIRDVNSDYFEPSTGDEPTRVVAGILIQGSIESWEWDPATDSQLFVTDPSEATPPEKCSRRSKPPDHRP